MIEFIETNYTTCKRNEHVYIYTFEVKSCRGPEFVLCRIVDLTSRDQLKRAVVPVASCNKGSRLRRRTLY